MLQVQAVGGALNHTTPTCQQHCCNSNACRHSNNSQPSTTSCWTLLQAAAECFCNTPHTVGTGTADLLHHQQQHTMPQQQKATRQRITSSRALIRVHFRSWLHITAATVGDGSRHSQ
jgi:hypothetical protein